MIAEIYLAPQDGGYLIAAFASTLNEASLDRLGNVQMEFLESFGSYEWYQNHSSNTPYSPYQK